ncbi:hypothetical protein BCV69DRAFT_295051 [Microstroma glucosiphilum]|uniref:Uncharacterized protein n=1 Tax=Pseudomicrostroma glucosiphilum TaxID=1684307 RepID=A0A316TZW8_9BASI|nr:hypothetical protein BCV69DRAFT_295051 [Pseudomicrostroma glucosiphilum]PWN18712.1 hypothetical protein BCV69DRAFT_295051 [Pseudomicrostroma glucosiphilum]
MTTTLPLTPTKLAAIPEAPHNLQVLSFIADQGNFVREVRPPSLSPMRNTQDRLFDNDQGEASVQGRPGSRSGSFPLPATPPSPSVSRMDQQLSSSPILKERAVNLPSHEKPRLSASALSERSDLDIAKVKKRARGALQDKKAGLRRASTSKAIPEPMLELEETAKRLEQRKNRRREKALVVQDRSRPVSARLRSRARAQDKKSKESNKENIVENGRTTVRGVTKENKKLREAVLAMEAYKPVSRLGSGRMTTLPPLTVPAYLQTDGRVKRGLFSKGAASAPVKVSGKASGRAKSGKTHTKAGQRAFCETRFLQTEQSPDFDTDEDSADPESHETRGDSRKQNRESRIEPKSATSAGKRRPRKRLSSQVDDESGDDGSNFLTQDSADEDEVTDDRLQYRSNDHKKARDSTDLTKARPHYGRRRKRTLLAAGRHRNLLTSPDGPAEDDGSSEGMIGADADRAGSQFGSEQSGLSEYSKVRRKKAKAQQKHSEKSKAREARPTEAEAAQPRGSKSRKGRQSDSSANCKSPGHRDRAATPKQADKVAREAAVTQVLRELPPNKRGQTAVVNGSDDSIYFDVRVKPAKTGSSHKRKLIGNAVDEEALRASLEGDSSPQGHQARYRRGEVQQERTEERHERIGTENAASYSAQEQAPSEVSRWRGSAWTSPKEDRGLALNGLALHRDDGDPEAPAADGMSADAPLFDNHQQNQAGTSLHTPIAPDPLPSRLDLADLANGWRLQHTRPQHHLTSTVDVSHRAHTFAGCSVEEMALQRFSSDPMTSLKGVASTTTHTPRVLTSSPQRNSAELNSMGLGALQLADVPLAHGQSEDHQLGTNLEGHDSSSPSESRSYPASGPCTIDENEEEAQSGEEVGSPRPFTAAAASTIFAGRAAWQDIKEAVDERNRSFSSDPPREEHDNAQWQASSDDVLLYSAPRAATPYRRMSRRLLSHLDSQELVDDMKVDDTFCSMRPPSQLYLERRDIGEPELLAEQAYSEEDVFHSAEDEGHGDGIVSGPISLCSRQGSELVEWLTPHSSQHSQPFAVMLQRTLESTAPQLFEPPQRLPSATTATRFTSRGPFGRLQLEGRTNSGSTSHSVYSNSSFDDLDFLSIRPGPGRVAGASGTQAPLVVGRLPDKRSAALTQGALSNQTRDDSSATSQTGTGTGMMTRSALPLRAAQQQQHVGANFWSRQQALETQRDLAILFGRASESIEQETHGPGAGAGAASSSLDPLDMDWAG